jgi:hypothetical protein
MDESMRNKFNRLLSWRRHGLAVCAFLTAISYGSVAMAQTESFSSPLSNLALPRPGIAMHEASTDPDHKNDGWRRVEAGQTLTTRRELFLSQVLSKPYRQFTKDVQCDA